MNNSQIISQLNEAIVHIESLVNELKTKKYEDVDDYGLSIDLQHILEHICLAWNFKDMSNDQVNELDQSQYESLAIKISDLVENFH